MNPTQTWHIVGVLLVTGEIVQNNRVTTPLVQERWDPPSQDSSVRVKQFEPKVTTLE